MRFLRYTQLRHQLHFQQQLSADWCHGLTGGELTGDIPLHEALVGDCVEACSNISSVKSFTKGLLYSQFSCTRTQCSQCRQQILAVLCWTLGLSLYALLFSYMRLGYFIKCLCFHSDAAIFLIHSEVKFCNHDRKRWRAQEKPTVAKDSLSSLRFHMNN